MELGDRWRAIEATDELRRVFPDPDLWDEDWTPVAVPGHWRSTPKFATTDGPMLYRCRFETPKPAGPERRFWVQLDGIFYDGDVWLDKSYLGVTEGYFFLHTFEVTEAIADRRQHLLAVEVACDPPVDRRAKRNLTGTFQHSDYIDQKWNPGGIWRPVHLLESGPVRISRLRVQCPEATAERATVDLRAGLDASRAVTAVLVTTLTRPDGRPVAEWRNERALAAGANQVDWRVAVDRPELWWPAALGDQPLYDLRVHIDIDGERSDCRQLRTGLRQIRMRNFVVSVNGERLFLKGADQGPTRRALAEVSAEEFEADVLLARRAGLDLLRLHGHISRDELYAAADRHGLLIWQDLPLHRGYGRVRRQAMRQATEAVDLLGHHPSIAIWCAHNEPVAVDRDPTGSDDEVSPTRRWAGFAAGQVLPSVNKTRLDRSVRRSLEKADGSRPVVTHSGVFPHPGWGTDTHLYLGWQYGDERDLPALLGRLPVLGRFVSEFGAQAVPYSGDFCEPERWPHLDWEHLTEAHAMQKGAFDSHVPPAGYGSFEAWRAASQRYQAQLVRFHVETLRRLKYRPTGGFCVFLFADSQPAISYSVLDDRRVPKAAYDALAAACAPVIVVADRLEAVYAPGQALDLQVHVVSDLRTALVDNRVQARLSWPGGTRVWKFEGDVDADACTRIGALHHVLPAASPDGVVTLELDLEWSGGNAHSSYESNVSSVTPL